MITAEYKKLKIKISMIQNECGVLFLILCIIIGF
jgi:hypothetical protein